MSMSKALTLLLLLTSTAANDIIPLFNDQSCPIIPECCEEDCCGPETSYTEQGCVWDPASGGWDGTYTKGYKHGCVPRDCCEDDCCDEGTIYDTSIQCCVAAERSFVPSPAPTAIDTCDVKIKGPDCICHEGGDDKHEFTAKGTPAPGKYKWSLTSTMAQIDGNDNTADVAVKTLKISEKADDVKLTVTYTVDATGMTCTDSVEFTVIKAVLSYKDNGGNGWDDKGNPVGGAGEKFTVPENDVKQFPEYGDPHLGTIEPGKPPKATGFHKNIEIEATITPCVALPKCTFDFKRTKQGYSGSIFEGKWKNAKSSVPPKWADDDAKPDTDEDLKLEVAEKCKLYVVDIPGIHVDRPCKKAEEGKIWFNYKNYREWLNVDEQRCTKDFPWRASTRIECKETAVAGKYEWMMVDLPDGTGNIVGEGHFETLYKPPGARRRVLESELSAIENDIVIG